MDLAATIRTVPDFPQQGIQFKDITTLLQNPEAFRFVIDTFTARYKEQDVTALVAADARGFIFGSALAYTLGLPLVLLRKEGKLPHKTISQEYDLEYGTATLEIHVDALHDKDRVVVVDDLLATGGTMQAARLLIEELGAEIVEFAFVIELPLLKGREKLGGHAIHALVEFMVD